MGLFYTLTFLSVLSIVYGRLVDYGLQWNEVRDHIWDTPAGNVFRVHNFSEINSLQGQLQPGDVMVMLVDGQWHDGKVNLTASGLDQVGYRIYLVPEVYGMVKFTGNVQIAFTGHNIEARALWFFGKSEDKVTAVWFEPQSSKCRLTNSAFTDWNQFNHTYKQHWVEMFGSYHRVDFCAFEDKIGTGNLLRVKTANHEFKPAGAQPDSWGHVISWNYFGPRDFEPDDDAEGIQIGLMQSEFVNTSTLVEFNLFEDYDGEIECISVKASHNVLRYNTFSNSACTLTLRHSNDSLIQENYFFCNYKFGCGGVRIYGGYHHVLNNYVEKDNFTTDDPWSRAGVLLFRGLSTDDYVREATNNLIEKNLLVNCSHCITANVDSVRGGDIDADHNVFIQNIMVAGEEDMYSLRDTGQTNALWLGNTAWGGIVDRIDEPEYASGIELRDPELEWDEGWGIWRPSAEGIQWDITYRPLQNWMVGPTWKEVGPVYVS